MAAVTDLSRRDFLRRAAAGAAVTLAGCSSKRAAGGAPPGSSTTATGPPSPATTGSPTTQPTGPPDWAALRSRLSGSLVLPADTGYATAAHSYNPLFDGRTPAAVARCARPEDVQACLEVAAKSRVPIAARSGGHSYAGYSVPNTGLVVDLAGLSAVKVQADGTATVGAGARLMDVYGALAAAGRGIPGGSCPTVGIAGLTLGGGIGVLSRQHGLTIDHLVGARVVTPDGMLRTASGSAEPDLFWALRGGGGGNLGIVTELTFSTIAAPAMAVMAMSFPGVPAGAILAGWQSWVQAGPPALWSNCIMSAGSPPTARVNASFLGSTADAGVLLDDLARRVGTGTAKRSVTFKSYLQSMLYFGGCSQYSLAQCRLSGDGPGKLGRESFVASSRVMDAPAADPAKVAALLAGRKSMDLIVDALGGAVAAVAPDATAFPHRKAFATVQIYVGTTAAGRPAAAQAVGEVRDGLAPLVGSGAYVNYIDPALRDWANAYYGPNLARLRQAAGRYDPDGVMSFAQGVGHSG